MKVLVTGGAGFIGSNFVRLTLAGASRRRDDGARRAHLRGQRGLASRRRPRHPGQGRHRRTRAGQRPGCGARPRGPLRRREPQRQLARQPVALHPDQHHRHVPAARGGAPARQEASPHLDRRGLRGPRARRPRQVHSRDAVQPVVAVLVARRPHRTCWCARGCVRSRSRRPSRTARTTTAPRSTSRSSSRARSPTCSTASAPSCTARARTCATGSTWTTTTARCGPSSTRASQARRTSSAPTARWTTSRSSR